MKEQFSLSTKRLEIAPLEVSDAYFIRELVNTEGWLKFIGNRNINTGTEAVAYIEKIKSNENISYWIVRLKDGEQSIGIITYIKRDYLDHHDIGFAFLPDSTGKGYAYEATSTVLYQLVNEQKLPRILATTIPENISSIKLLQKIGLQFEKEIEISNEKLHVYGADAGELKI